MPKEVFDKDYQYLPHSALLSFEEITRLARMFAAHGVRKIRLTGGEPLLRKNIEVLIEQLAALRTPDGQPLDLTLTTNGSLLARKAAGAEGRRPAARDRQPRRPGRRGVPPHERRRLSGGRRARRHRGRAGRRPRRRSRSTWSSSAAPTSRRSCRWRATSAARGVVLRFIEYMDVGATNGWRMDEVLPSAEVVARIAAEFPLRAARGQRARRNRAALGLRRRRRRDRRDQQRDAGLLPRLQPRAPVDRRQALPLPVRQPAATTCGRCCAAAPSDDADRLGHRPHLAGPRRPLFRTARSCAAADTDAGARAPRRDELHRRMSASLAIAASDRSPAWCSPAAAARAWAASTRACRTSTACRWPCTRCCAWAAGRRDAWSMPTATWPPTSPSACRSGPMAWPTTPGPLAGFLTGLERCETP